MTWHIHPDVLVMVAALAGLYAYGARWAGDKLSPRVRPTRLQTLSYGSGVLVLYLGAGTPLHDIGERYLFSAHMVQHMLFSLIAPPLLLLGIPDWMLRPLIQRERVRRVAAAITQALPAFFFFNMFLLFSHLPPVMDFVLRHHSAHLFAHVALVTTALLMWWPVFSPLPELPRVPEFPRIIYLFVQSLVPAVIASFLAFATDQIYPFYASAPRRLWNISVMQDQMFAGLIMKLAGALVIWFFMAVIFFRWFNEEDQRVSAAPGNVKWGEIEAELERMGLTKR